MERTEKKGFSYSYSSKVQNEIERIREKYAPYKEQDETLAKMQDLDRQAEKAAMKQPVYMGMIGTALLAAGLIGTLAMSGQIWFVLGIIVGVIGVSLMGVAYPLYGKRIKEERERIAPQILTLAKRENH